ncbi:alpha/beta hydrolase [Qipengyuania marisflavi]|uniref:Palmitoyl-protein thioesterase ABHD10, mitochondrial n=1 Tax=Qipengyuania marisflavi TaxID=2486356 RepID=A0A5S3P647_9SPHN|nr:alpha/beta hydrolase [Qipengyuania marisflavi]TMM48311.1 alpha/beta hydrolase [Qipengyuania marisflavi]
MIETQFHTMPDGRRVAFRLHRGADPALVFLPGYMSDMAGGKASALMAWAQQTGRSCLLMDYSGCGTSAGEFADGTLSRWSAEVAALIKVQLDGPVVLVGSSMGGWLMLLVARALSTQVAGLIGIAAAPDFTDWGYGEGDKARLAAGEIVLEDNPYGPEPTPIHPGFFADGQAQLQLGSTIPIDAPVRLIHGQRDADVPWRLSLQLAEALRSDDIQVTLVKDGDHRLSRPQDIALLLRTAALLTETFE